MGMRKLLQERQQTDMNTTGVGVGSNTSLKSRIRGVEKKSNNYLKSVMLRCAVPHLQDPYRFELR